MTLQPWREMVARQIVVNGGYGAGIIADLLAELDTLRALRGHDRPEVAPMELGQALTHLTGMVEGRTAHSPGEVGTPGCCQSAAAAVMVAHLQLEDQLDAAYRALPDSVSGDAAPASATLADRIAALVMERDRDHAQAGRMAERVRELRDLPSRPVRPPRPDCGRCGEPIELTATASYPLDGPPTHGTCPRDLQAMEGGLRDRAPGNGGSTDG